jgi:hypothetical protein
MWDMSDPLGKKDDEKVHMGCLAPGTYPQSSDVVFGGGVDDFLRIERMRCLRWLRTASS